MLLASRLIMGIAEGPLMPICLAILTVESSPTRRGLNVGFVQSVFASLLGAAIAPLVLVQLSPLLGVRLLRILHPEAQTKIHIIGLCVDRISHSPLYLTDERIEETVSAVRALL
jgi:MFS family permease